MNTSGRPLQNFKTLPVHHAEARSKMIKLLTAFLLFTIGAMSLSIAHAEEQTNDAVIVPFEFNGRICGMLENGNFVCEWDPSIIDLNDIIVNGTETIPNPTEASTKVEDVPEPIVIEEEPETILTKFEQDMERLIEKDDLDPKEKEYLALLQNLAECQRGYAESFGVVTPSSFAISYTWINDRNGESPEWTKAFDYTGRHAELKKGIEECKAIRTILNPVTLGAYTLHMGQYFGQIQPHHSEKAIVDEGRWLDVKTHVPLNEHNFIESVEDAQKTICTHTLYEQRTKSQYDCPPVEYPDGDIVNPKGFVEYGSSVEDKFLKYQTDGGAQQAKQITGEKYREKLQQLQEVMKAQQNQYTGEGYGN